MDTIKGTVLDVANDYENVFHITVKAQIPEGVALVRFSPVKVGTDPTLILQIGQKMSRSS